MMLTRKAATDQGGGNLSGQGGSSSTGSGANDGKPTLPTTVEGWQAYHNEFATKSKTEIDGLNLKLTDHQRTIGVQGNELGPLRKLAERARTDPTLISEIAQNLKLQVTIGDPTLPSIAQALTDFQDKKIDAAKYEEIQQKHTQRQIEAAKRADLTAEQRFAIKTALKTKYPDYDNLEGDRNVINAEMSAGTLTPSELLHLAAQGRNLPEALKAAGAEGYQKALDEIYAKVQASHAAPGTQQPANAVGPVSKKKLTVGTVIDAISKA